MDIEYIEKLPKKLYDRAIAAGVTEIHLNFSGGNDEGYLNVNLFTNDDNNHATGNLERDIENWAWKAYKYNGAGDGNDYGDDIVYDLKNNTVRSSEWYMERTDRDIGELKLETVEEEDLESQG